MIVHAPISLLGNGKALLYLKPKYVLEALIGALPHARVMK